ncbi:MAG TPA: energy transducer TonB [Chitinophagales bacterium]|nr:energy transducer TonB [Chitinophagales bacterium]HMX59877.1 energy transducer TonB [Chitinophagales bacterium]HNB49669.1 energy transducer TonB [Chitinophagales bacterium]HNC72279.1 energy transducer TonB [Chitinophagales bacterium]HNF18849.1 energy transducer TonB [Chitinophagales bacterium]
MSSKIFTLLLISFFFILICGFKPPKVTAPKNDILYSKYGGDIEKMMREERRLDSLKHPYLYQQKKEDTIAASSIDDESVIIEKAAIMPQFPDGDAGLQEYIKTNTNFIPDTLVGKKASVMVKFYINTLGDAKNPKVIKTDNPSFELQTLLLVEGMPKWTPAKQNGKEVNCYITLTIKYGE